MSLPLFPEPIATTPRAHPVDEAPSQDVGDASARLARHGWPQLHLDLNQQGCALLPGLLTKAECRQVAALYTQDALFRSRVVMQRHGFGQGEYKYLAYPLPALVHGLRTALYPQLVPLANHWNELMRLETRYPPRHEDFIARCHAAGQQRPTPLLLSYGPGDHNCLHQDLYGEHVFPIQVAVLLSAPGRDFTGGEFVMAEQRPRMQSRVEVVPLQQGDAVAFAVHHRPVQGTRGSYRVQSRHGVSRVRSGHRHTLGLIFHDAT
ncbi:MAG TPA: 2OG-Fe(II) oxygenase [Candidatus Aquabacterium excrementipullorum]|nr:2OG-Fe(II) oxygenase [Candidatus Aquabacterium excrementipullorum]